MIVSVQGEIIKDLVEGKFIKANKDDCTYIKAQRQVYLFIQFGLGYKFATMSYALGPQTGPDIFSGKFNKITKKSTKPLLRPAWHKIVVQQTIQTAAHMYTECTVLFSLAQYHFAKQKRCR
jgi:hypothetical protein